MNWIKLFSCATLAIVYSKASFAVGPYVVTDLGVVPGGFLSEGYAINSAGQVVGTSVVPGAWRAFLWSPSAPNGTSGTMVDIGIVRPDNLTNAGVAINTQGQIAIKGFPQGDGASSIWTPQSANGALGTMTPLGAFDITYPFTDVAAINSLGRVAGTSRVGTDFCAYVWNPAVPNGTTGEMIALDGLPSEISNAGATDMNARGQVVGAGMRPYVEGAGRGRAFIWHPASPNGSTGVATPIDQALQLNISSAAYAINDVGQVVGEFGPIPKVATSSFLWLPNDPNGSVGSLVDLGTLPGIPFSRAVDINIYGQVVGLAFDTRYTNRPYVWTPTTSNSKEGAMIDLNDLLDPKSGSGWTLTYATSINDFGQIVAGGLFDADGPGGEDPVTRAVLLNPVPEPATLLLLTLGAIGITIRKRRRVCRP